MAVTVARLVLDRFETEAGFHADTMHDVLGYSIEALRTASATPRRRVQLDHLADDLAKLQALATPTEWNFSHLSRLQDTIVQAAFLRPGNDQPDTDNPIYNVLVWLADALTNAGALARLNVTCRSGARVVQIDEEHLGV